MWSGKWRKNLDRPIDVVVKIARGRASHAGARLAGECQFLRRLQENDTTDAIDGHRSARCLAWCTQSEGSELSCEGLDAVLTVQTALGGQTLDSFASTTAVVRSPPAAPGNSSAMLLRFSRAALRTLAWLWERGGSHRDISGANILYEEVGDTVHLVDFDSAVWPGAECATEIGSAYCAYYRLECLPQAGPLLEGGRCPPSHLMQQPPWQMGTRPITYNGR